MLRSIFLAVIACVVATAATPQTTKIAIGTTPLADVMPAFVAKSKGFFEKRNLDVGFNIIPLNPTIPAALMAKSIQVGAPNAAVFIQAVDGGLDLQLIAGSTVTPSMGAGIAYVTRADVAYDGPKSLEGKKIIIPGMGSSVDVLFRKWLADQGIDEKKVNFVEIASAQTNDTLVGKTVDGAVVVEPFLTRVQQSGAGKIGVRFMDGLADRKLGIAYVATREWIGANKAAAKAFSDAIDEAIAFADANQQEARKLVQPYLNLPQQVIDALPFPVMDNKLTPESIAFWIDVMKQQNRLKGAPKASDLVGR
jgi:NitT/TauT family transport system substrate-binding protein